MFKSKAFPQEPIYLFINGEKMIFGTSFQIRFAAHQNMVKVYFCSRHNILHEDQSEKVYWPRISTVS